MDRSKLSNIIATTRLLPFFSTQHVSQIKSCIFEQLGCQNESQFLCKVLQSLYKNMSVESTSIIKNTTFTIADSQVMPQSMTQTRNNNINIGDTKKAICTNNNRITIYKHIQQQYTDPLSKLHSDIIDYFGSFLSKRQSIEFGYLNKQLFIETQKHSYLLKRCKDPPLIINDRRARNLIMTRAIPFSYYFPNSLELDLHGDSKWYHWRKEMSGYQNCFRGLNILDCRSFLSLSVIPCEMLCNTTQHQIKKFKIDAIIGKKSHQHVETFCQRLNEHKNNIISSGGTVCNIEEFELNWFTHHAKMTRQKKIIKQLILACGSFSQSIRLNDVLMTINTIQDLKTIFHPNMKNLHFQGESSFTINMVKPNITNNDGSHTSTTQVGRLKSLVIQAEHRAHARVNTVHPIINTLNDFDRFGMRRLIKHYTIEWTPLRQIFLDNIGFDNSFDIFDKILFQDYDKHPLLEKITVKFNIKQDLSAFARLLVYFNDKYKQLFGVERKLYLKYFKHIEIEFDKMEDTRFGNTGLFYKYETYNGVSYLYHEMIFSFFANQEYPTDKKTIEIRNIEQGIASFGVLYQNVFQWLQKALVNESNNCKIVFVME